MAIRGGWRAARNGAISCAVLLAVIEGAGIGLQRVMAGQSMPQNAPVSWIDSGGIGRRRMGKWVLIFGFLAGGGCCVIRFYASLIFFLAFSLSRYLFPGYSPRLHPPEILPSLVTIPSFFSSACGAHVAGCKNSAGSFLNISSKSVQYSSFSCRCLSLW